MIAQQNEYISDASQTLYELNADEIIRQKCRAREEYQQHENAINKKMADLTAEVEQLRAKLAQYEKANTQ